MRRRLTSCHFHPVLCMDISGIWSLTIVCQLQRISYSVPGFANTLLDWSLWTALLDRGFLELRKLLMRTPSRRRSRGLWLSRKLFSWRRFLSKGWDITSTNMLVVCFYACFMAELVLQTFATLIVLFLIFVRARTEQDTLKYILSTTNVQGCRGSQADHT